MKPKHVLITGILALLGWLGIPPAVRWVQSYSAQQQALAQAPNLLAEVSKANPTRDLERLRSQQQRLQSTIQLLEGIPNLPTFAYQEAQARLQQLRPAAAAIEQQIAAESQSTDGLKRALELDAQALELANQPPHPEERLKQAADKWREAIKLLENVPAQSAQYPQAQQGLPPLRQKQRQVEQWLTAEKQAVRKMEAALVTAKQAIDLTRDRPVLENAVLVNANAQWTRVVNFLREIPGNTTVSEDASNFLPVAERNLQQMKAAIAQFKQCESANRTPGASLLGMTAASNACGYGLAVQPEEFPVQLAAVEESLPPPVTPTVTPSSAVASRSHTTYLRRYRSYRLGRFPRVPIRVAVNQSPAGGASVSVGRSSSGSSSGSSYTRSGFSRVRGFGFGRSSGGG